ncbi:MAG: AAA family ATPase [Acidobacteriia bacterium]|nr:AAA family ATPase [Terriglobia bacterium]
MFLDFYKLPEQPFGVTPDPRYLYLSPTHREALASLLHGVQCGRGFMTLVAKPGMGKTTLLFCLLERLRRSAKTAFLFQTQCNSRELLRHLLADLGIDTGTEDVVEMHRRLNKFLVREAERGRRTVVIIDEAQNLHDEVLESVRLLSNFETPSAKLIQVILAGQPPLADKLASPSLVQLRQRLAMAARLEPFTAAETDRYIDHRLWASGHSGADPFNAEARALIAALSEGIPRNINNLCFNALSLGRALQRKPIDASIVEEAAADADITPLGSERPKSRNAAASFPAGQSVSAPLTGQRALLRAMVMAGKASQSPAPPQTKASEAVQHADPKASPGAPCLFTPVEKARSSRRIPQVAAICAALLLLPLFAIRPAAKEGGPALPAARAAVAPTSSPSTVSVVAKPNENLTSISRYHLGGFDDKTAIKIRQLNPKLTNLNHIEAGQHILLPQQPEDRGWRENLKPEEETGQGSGSRRGVQ